jgi:triosephosphate isomerase (TIM)
MNPNRTPLIAGNWKMNLPESLSVYLSEIIDNQRDGVEMAICVPYTHIELCADALIDTDIAVGAQNIHHENAGAFTGEVSGRILSEVGANYVIIGHSERREYQGESKEVLTPKLKVALENNICAIFCVGEKLDQRKAGTYLEVVAEQLRAIPSDYPSFNLVIAYEPVWAIGTGETATPEQANEVHAFIRQQLRKTFGEVAAEEIRILYGGSMKPSNAKSLLEQPEVDGGLIGGASLVAADFLSIAASCG